MHLAFRMNQKKQKEEKRRVISVKCSEYEELIRLIELTKCAKIEKSRKGTKVYIEQRKVKPTKASFKKRRKRGLPAIQEIELIKLPKGNMAKKEDTDAMFSGQGQFSAIISK